MQRSRSLTRLVTLSFLSAIAFIMQALNFPLPLFPQFLKIDFSEIPALIGGLLFGPMAGIGIEAMKNLLHFLFYGSDTGIIPVGQISNFVAGSIFVTLTVIISRKVEKTKGLWLGLGAATLMMAVVMTIANWYVIFPAYSFLIDWTVTESQKWALVIMGVAPFNIVKGILIAIIFVPLYAKVKPHLDQRFGIS